MSWTPGINPEQKARHLAGGDPYRIRPIVLLALEPSSLEPSSIEPSSIEPSRLPEEATGAQRWARND
jgi:hypothetical protein